MTQPDYSGTAVITFHEAGFGEGMWRASCPVDCGWHGSDWTSRDDAEAFRTKEAKGHKCLRVAEQEKWAGPADGPSDG